ncbi:hypothetical protein EN844_27060 [Mesorhizobium sp. M3A.F.Ca.ET.201.01.1.1]|nr:hypothetical protein EN844_27060 [Mesorhizobium sp. M3A.F.Ca.ET.201.01.1.1]
MVERAFDRHCRPREIGGGGGDARDRHACKEPGPHHRHYVETRKSHDWPISTGQAVTAIRCVLPQCTLSDRQIADLVASAAIARHRNLAFDHSAA